jgi:type II secretory pathway pseudopilin PulG
MTQSPLRSRAGFTYIAALVMVVVIGIMAAKGAELWSTRMKRERETELIFRGCQVRDALRRWYKIKIPPSGIVTQPATDATAAAAATATAAAVAGGGTVPLQGASPTDLQTLVSGSSSAAKVHYLRPSSLIDPITGKEWALVKDASQRIIGVASTSEAEPLKKGNFPFDLDPTDFEAKKKYSDWQFICNKFPKPGAAGGVTGLGGSANPTGATGPGGSSNPSGAAGGGATGSGGASGSATGNLTK